MICLGLEGTAHTTGAGIVNSKYEILANEAMMYTPKDGIHPREAANFHAKNVVKVIKKSLKKSKLNISKLDLIAFSQGPGLGPCLRTIATSARALALSLNIPIIGINHCIAHLEVGKKITKCRDPVLLYVSGGNTQVISFSNGRYRVFGETLDIGIGNMLDKFGRFVKLGFPCGPEIERLARKSKKLIDLPYSIKGMDVSFSGILTTAQNLVGKEKIEDICYSLQETTFAMLVEVTERAMAHLGKDEVLLGGGVACNKRLQAMVKNMAEKRGAKFFVPDNELLVDNGAMIALTGLIMYRSGIRMDIKDTVVKQRFRTDDVDVRWI